MGKFRTWIKDQGGPKVVARKLNTESPLIHNWLARLSTPRPRTMQKLVRMSKGKLTFDDIINETSKPIKRVRP